MIKFRDLFRRQKAAGQVHVQSKPTLDADHEHDIVELPTNMGKSVLRMCRTKGCDYMKTVDATAEQQAEVAPLTDAVRGFQDQVLGDVERELGQRRKHR